MCIGGGSSSKVETKIVAGLIGTATQINNNPSYRTKQRKLKHQGE